MVDEVSVVESVDEVEELSVSDSYDDSVVDESLVKSELSELDDMHLTYSENLQ